MTTEEIQLHIHHQPCPEPRVASAACKQGWENEPVACCVPSTIKTETCNHNILFVFILSCMWCVQTVSGISVVTGRGSTNTFWCLVRRWKLSHMWGSRSGKSLAVSWLAKFLVCGLVIWAGPRHALVDLGQWWNHPVFWLSTADSCTPCACSIPLLKNQSCEGSQYEQVYNFFTCDFCYVSVSLIIMSIEYMCSL